PGDLARALRRRGLLAVLSQLCRLARTEYALRFNGGGAWEREFQFHRRRRTGTLAGAARLGGILLHPGRRAAAGARLSGGRGPSGRGAGGDPELRILASPVR